MKEERVIITGGSGFIGTNLIEDLRSQNKAILNLDLLPPKISEHLPYWKQCDIRDREQFEALVSDFKPTVVVHLAARTDLHGKSIDDYSANTKGVENLIKISQKCTNLRLILFISSRLVNRIGYQPKSDDDYCPTTLYGESKMIGEKIVRADANQIPCSWMILRPTSIWGPWFGTPYNDFFMSIIRSLYIHPKNLPVKKSFGFIGNTVFELNKIIERFPKSFNGKTLYLCDFVPIDVLSWSRQIAALYGVRPPKEVNFKLLQFIAKCGDVLKKIGYKEPPLTSFRLNNIITDMVYDTKELEEFCGPLPFNQSDGIRETLNWIQNKK